MKRITVYSKKRGLRYFKPGITLEAYREKYPDAFEVTIPSQEELDEMARDLISDAVDGCGGLEADSYCKHGYPSWLIALGYI